MSLESQVFSHLLMPIFFFNIITTASDEFVMDKKFLSEFPNLHFWLLWSDAGEKKKSQLNTVSILCNDDFVFLELTLKMNRILNWI